MKKTFPILLVTYLSLAVTYGPSAIGAATDAGQTGPVEGWPRMFNVGSDTVIAYQPQIQSWDRHVLMKAVSAVKVTLADQKKDIYGALYMAAVTETNSQSRTVMFTNIRITDLQFPNVDAKTAKRCSDRVRLVFSPKSSVPISLDRVIAALERSKLQQRTVEVNLEPPPIYYSNKPAILVMFMGEPRFKPVKNTGLLFATNTNWDLFLELKSKNYYLLNGESWLTTKDVMKGPWAPTSRIPSDLRKLPDDKNWEDVKRNLPGKLSKTPPSVLVTTGPAELVITDGEPSLGLIPGVSLFYVSNTDSHVFFHLDQQAYYFLTAGRWFRAKKLTGPWTAASNDLPAEFARIPKDHPKAAVLSSVPGSEEAEAAVLLASIPQKAKVDRKNTTVTIVYEDKPKFVVIEGTTVYYAVNTPHSVFLVEKKYYCCNQGIWFVAINASGPWTVCTVVPKAIYTIPPTHPTHNVTYVYVYDSTPDTVVVGYTSGYSGEYVAKTGALMFGLGFLLGHAVGEDHDDHWDHYHHHHSHYYSYGCGAHYDYYHGGYHRSAQHYGPYGGAGRAAAYNPATGTYARGAYRYGPSGGAFAASAYNPHTGGYAARAGASTPYGSWGRTVVGEGNDWVQAGHRSQGGKTVAGIETSKGGAAVGGYNKWTGQGAVVGKDKHGDVYAGKNGNVYKRDGDSWQKNTSSGWETIDRPERSGTGSSRTGTSRSGTGASRPGTSRSGGLSASTREQLNREFSSRQTGSSRSSTFKQRSSGGSSGRSRPSRGGGRR